MWRRRKRKKSVKYVKFSHNTHAHTYIHTSIPIFRSISNMYMKVRVKKERKKLHSKDTQSNAEYEKGEEEAAFIILFGGEEMRENHNKQKLCVFERRSFV